jgi:hypothetical protein
MKSDKRGQVTIFIIIGILIVAAILLALYFTGKISFVNTPSENPEAYLRNCMMTSAKEAEKIVLESNGHPQVNSTNYVFYNKEKIPYACTVSEFYAKCIPQDPGFFSYITRLMENKVARDTENCLNTLVEDFEDKGYVVQVDPGNTTLRIQKESIYVDFGRRIYATRDQDSKQIANIDATYGTKLYSIIKLEQTIVNYESTICDFNKNNWMKYDNSVMIFTTRTSDQTKIYTLKERLTGREIKFAIKTCLLPAGI